MLAAQCSNPLHAPQSTILIPPKSRPRASSNTAAASSEDTSVISTLLSHNAPLATTDHAGDTALHYASAWGNLKGVRVLVAAGAPTSVLNNAMCTPADYSLTRQAAAYFQSLIAEFERKKAEDQQLHNKLKLKVKESDIGQFAGAPQARMSPISPAEARLKEPGKLNLGGGRTGPVGAVGGVRLVQDDFDQSIGDAPLTARKIGMLKEEGSSDEDESDN
jgi:ankyrin repeat protein